MNPATSTASERRQFVIRWVYVSYSASHVDVSMSLMTCRVNHEDFSLRISWKRENPSFSAGLPSDCRCHQGLYPPTRATNVDIYTCRGTPIYRHHLLDGLYHAQQLRWKPRVGRTVPCSAVFKVSAVHIHISLQILGEAFNSLNARTNPSPLT